jgi:hypothetical protein
MNKEVILNQFSKRLLTEHNRKNGVLVQHITSTLKIASLNMAFVNESCKSSGEVSKSQVIYRKLNEKSINDIKDCFQKQTLQFLKLLKISSRNRKFIISFDTTEEDYYGKFSTANEKEKLYLHEGSDRPGAKYHYEYLTVAITCDNGKRFILDGIIVKRGMYVEDYVYEMTKWIRKQLPIEVVLFDRGFGWGVIYKLKQLNVHYMVFWKKQGSWYKKHFRKLKDGEYCEVIKNYKYNRDKTNFKVSSNFILVK